jgi:NADH-quinone oxidoreductase subunit H
MSIGTPVNLASLPPDWPGNFWWHLLLLTVLLIGFLMTTVIIFIWFERRVIARFQIRIGPNRAGPFGLLQPIADVLKILTKEDIIPSKADKIVFWLAPIVAFVPVLMVLAVVPLQNGLQLVDLNIGVIYIVAVSSLSALGIFMAGWSSNNKYGLIGAMREVALLLSYEIPMVLTLVSLVLLSESLSLSGIIAAQSIPFILIQPLGFIIFFLASLAEINRSPFDLIEADSELATGFNIEYSGMKFAVLYLVEYSEAVVASTLITTFFLGGWRGPFLPPIIWLMAKIFITFFFILWVRATLPRLRIDQAMAFAWKCLLPLALINLVITALKVVFLPELSLLVVIPVYIIITFLLIMLWSRLFRPGKQALDG